MEIETKNGFRFRDTYDVDTCTDAIEGTDPWGEKFIIDGRTISQFEDEDGNIIEEELEDAVERYGERY